MRATKMTVSLAQIEKNARAIRARIPAGVKLLGVVKADAYGHGAAAVAGRLETTGCADYLAVAIAEEGVALRAAGIRMPVMILGACDETSLADIVHDDLEQAVYSEETLAALEAEALRQGHAAQAHLAIDTGMTRIGVRPGAETDKLLDAWRRCPHVRMAGIFTHFCVADTDAAFTEGQRVAFEQACAQAHAAGFTPIAHAAASTAMLKDGYAFSMVRMGIALYGTGVPALAGQVAPAQRLTTYPVRLATVPAGTSVGYGRHFIAQRETRVMTLPIGYGDGYPRLLGGRAEVLVCGRRAPIIGSVCMDMLMADVTDIPQASMAEEVVLLGRQGQEVITPDELAAFAETIPYEIMLGFSPRVPRVYEA